MIEPDNRIIRDYFENHPRQAIDLIEEYPHAEIADLLGTVPADIAAKIVEELVPFKAFKSLEPLEDQILIQVFAKLPTKRISSLLLRFRESQQRKILKGLPKLKRDAVGSQWQYPVDSVGAQMDMDLITLRIGQEVRECLATIKRDIEHTQSQIYVINKSGEMEGYVELRDLISAAEDKKVDTMLQDKPMTFLPSINVRDLLTQWDYRYIHLPVVDADDVFLGTISRRVIKDYAGGEELQQQPSLRAGSALSELYRIGFLSLLGSSAD